MSAQCWRGLVLAVVGAVAASAASASLQLPPRVGNDPEFIKGLIPGWTGLVDPSGRCRFSVPGQWTIQEADRLALAPDGAATAVEEWTAAPSWTGYKNKVYSLLKPTALHDDGEHRLWFEYAAGWAGVHHHVAVSTDDGVCVLEIDVQSRGLGALESVVRRIAGSLIALH